MHARSVTNVQKWRVRGRESERWGGRRKKQRKNESNIKHICEPNDYLFPNLVQCIWARHIYTFIHTHTQHTAHARTVQAIRISWDVIFNYTTQRMIQHNKRKRESEMKKNRDQRSISMKKKLEKIYRLCEPMNTHYAIHSSPILCMSIWVLCEYMCCFVLFRQVSLLCSPSNI